MVEMVLLFILYVSGVARGGEGWRGVARGGEVGEECSGDGWQGVARGGEEW